MEPSSPSNNLAEIQYVTPECSSRFSVIFPGNEDSGYSSVPSSGISTKTFRENSLSPVDVRKRLFDSADSSCTPGISQKTRTSRRRPGRCLIPMVTLQEEIESHGSGPDPTIKTRSVVHGLSTPNKSFLEKLSTIPSPKKRHSYTRENAVEKVYKTSGMVFGQKTRTPPRKGRTSSTATKFPSFSDRSVYRDPCRPRYGAQYVDFLWCLGKERMMAPALSLVLSHLSDEDLIACCIVSKTWQTLVMSDKNANSRRLTAIERWKLKKENIACVSLLNKINTHKENRTVLGVIQQERLIPPGNVHMKTPPPKLSPKSFRFQLYMKEGLRVDGNDSQHLKSCPRCSFPSIVDTKLNVGVCSRHGCQFRYCTLCHCSDHLYPINGFPSSSPPRYIVCPFAPKDTTPPSPPHTALLATRRRLDLVNSKRSKRNLRRL
ncbi:uncharacterized protein [Hetaerina americana]|uniref:uncharacterized protein n=1 Tax=Hetaerina americana TaxID=62018 RepID=UPI003A7F4128